jgi:hypothetical protein
MGSDPAGRQAGREDIPLEAGPGAGDDVHPGMHDPHGSGVHGVLELTLGKATVQPLTTGEQAVLP